MQISKDDLLLLAASLVVTLGITWTFLWWAAFLFSDWGLILNFNSRNEQWVEGVLFHAITVFGLWLIVRLVSCRGKD